MIEPLIFGEKQLFGVYYPSSDSAADSLVVVCPPLFDEYRRSYRALGEFAAACAEKGHHALRFDYSGTGDSGGFLEDLGSIDEWLDDIDSAIEEGMNLSGAGRVCLFGVRWGGTLASLCRHDAVERVLVWDRIEDGPDYTKWLQEIDSSVIDEHRPITPLTGGEHKIDDYRMFALNSSMLASIDKVRIEKTEKPVTNFRSHLGQVEKKSDKDSIDVNFSHDWLVYGGGLIRPMLALRTILDHL